MKKGYGIYKIILLITLISVFSATEIHAEDSDIYTENEIYSAVEGLLTENPDISDISSAAEAGNIASDALSAKNLLNFTLRRLQQVFSGSFPVLFPIIALIFLSSVISVFKTDLGSSSRILEYASVMAVMLITLSAVKPLLITVSDYLAKFSTFMASVSATMGLLMSSGGSPSAAAASSSSAAFSIAVTQILSEGAILPCVKIIIAFSVTGALSRVLDLSGVINFLRGFCTWGLGVLFAVFGGLHAATVKIASGADTLAVRGIRFTAARLIPVAGNMLSESLKTVVSAVGIIKNTLGGLGIAYILYALIPPVCSIMSVKLVIIIASFCSKLIGSRPHTGFLEGINSALNILLAICLFSSVSGILIFAVFMNTAAQV